MKEFLTRSSVALVGIPILVFLAYNGGLYFLAFVAIVNAMALWEFYKMFENKDIYANRFVGVALSSVFLIATFFYPVYWKGAALGTIALMLLLHLRNQKGLASTNTAYTIAGFGYITLLLTSLLILRENFSLWAPGYSTNDFFAGGWFIIVLMVSIWICDTAAYLGGKAMGKHKLAPNVSPNKTIEGGLFGLIFGILTFWGLGKLWLPELPLNYALACGAIVGIFGQLGDLAESRFKRDAGVKDTSAILPGHGGILDRFDSLIFVSPFLYLLFSYRLLG